MVKVHAHLEYCILPEVNVHTHSVSVTKWKQMPLKLHLVIRKAQARFYQLYKSLIAEWLLADVSVNDMYSHNLKVISSNLCWLNLKMK